MNLPNTITRFLRDNATDYSVVHHPYTATSTHTAEAAHISGERIAKAVLLHDKRGYLLAVLPATHTLHINQVREKMGRDVDIAPEEKLAEVFPDCALGAVPSIGPAYGLETIFDEALCAQPTVYFEAGTHEDLVCVAEERFENLLADALRFRFSSHKH